METNNKFYRVMICYDEGGEASNGDDFPTLDIADKFSKEITIENGQHVEIYEMQETDGHVEFIDQIL